MRKIFFQMNEETARNRLGHSGLLLLVGLFTTMLLRDILIGKFIGICFLYVGVLGSTHAVWFGKSLKLPKWMSYLLLFLSIVMIGVFIVMFIGFVFFGW